jgi:hypothetical protein
LIADLIISFPLSENLLADQHHTKNNFGTHLCIKPSAESTLSATLQKMGLKSRQKWRSQALIKKLFLVQMREYICRKQGL